MHPMNTVTSSPLPARPLALPNILTYARIATVPLVVGILFWHSILDGGLWLRWVALALFIGAAVTDVLDGAPPRAVRVVGDGAASPRPGAWRVARDGRSDAEIEAALAAQLGRIAIAHGPLPAALLEARLRNATAVTLAAPDARPAPWPRDASLVLVLYGSTSSWVADLPALA